MKMKTVVSMTKTISDGTPVSYGRIYTGEGDTAVATVPVGYADGYPRALSGKAFMRVGGATVPVIGRICMDQCMLDVSGVDGVREGMTVTVLDDDPACPLSVDAVAAATGTINYEILCGINKRVPRLYFRSDNIEAIADYMK